MEDGSSPAASSREDDAPSPVTGPAAAEQMPEYSGPETAKGQGYRLTDHVLRYYQTTRS